jgi:hypothetical protein
MVCAMPKAMIGILPCEGKVGQGIVFFTHTHTSGANVQGISMKSWMGRRLQNKNQNLQHLHLWPLGVLCVGKGGGEGGGGGRERKRERERGGEGGREREGERERKREKGRERKER